MEIQFFCIILPVVFIIGSYIGYLQGRVKTLHKKLKLMEERYDYYYSLVMKSNAQETCPKYLKEYKGE